MVCKLVENVFNIFLWICCWKKKLIYKYEKTPFNASYVGNELTSSNLELSNVRWFEEPKIVLPKLASMNDCHWNFGCLNKNLIDLINQGNFFAKVDVRSLLFDIFLAPPTSRYVLGLVYMIKWKLYLCLLFCPKIFNGFVKMW